MAPLCTGGLGRGSACRDGGADRAEQDRRPTGRFAEEKTKFLAAQSIENECYELLFGSNKQTQILYKSMEEQSPRLTRGLFAVYLRDEGHSSFLAADQCTDAYLSL